MDRANFLNHLDLIRTKFNELDELSTEVTNLSLTVAASTTAHEFRLIHNDFSEKVQNSSQLIKLIKAQIDALEVSNKDFESKHADERGSEINMRRIAWAGLASRLRTSLISFNKAQNQFETTYNGRTNLNGLNPDLSASPDASPVGAIGQAFVEASNESDTIRKQDLLRLELTLKEIREAFLQIATLVDSQGELLEWIEYATVNAKNYGHLAAVELIQARKKQRRKLWLKFCCFSFLGLLAIFLVFLILDKTGVLRWMSKAKPAGTANTAGSLHTVLSIIVALAVTINTRGI